MAKTAQDAIDIMQRVIGEQNSQDPNASESALLGYISDFYNLMMPQDVKVYENYSFFEFDLVADQAVYPLNVAPLPINEFVNLQPPAFIGIVKLWWYQDPDMFYTKWPLDTQNLGTGKPTDVLFWGNELVFRTVPNDTYTVRIVGYHNNGTLTDATDPLFEDYFWRYIAYGAAMDWLSDYGQMEEVVKITPMYQRYRSIMLNRTAKQYSNQVPRLCI